MPEPDAHSDRQEQQTLHLRQQAQYGGQYRRQRADSHDAKASIPRSVHTVGAYAGFNSPIQSLVVPKHVVEIQENAFGNCRQLQKVQLGKGLKTIGKYAFNGCSKIDKLFIPASVETIDYGAFSDCEGLRTCTFEDDISISTSWFVGCHDLVIKSGKSRIQYN